MFWPIFWLIIALVASVAISSYIYEKNYVKKSNKYFRQFYACFFIISLLNMFWGVFFSILLQTKWSETPFSINVFCALILAFIAYMLEDRVEPEDKHHPRKTSTRSKKIRV